MICLSWNCIGGFAEYSLVSPATTVELSHHSLTQVLCRCSPNMTKALKTASYSRMWMCSWEVVVSNYPRKLRKLSGKDPGSMEGSSIGSKSVITPAY